MSEQRYTPDMIVRAETLVSRVQGISSCRITADETGEIAEVHVVATARKSPKLVARDVQSCLSAELGMTLDYKKIGVVLFEADASPEQDLPVQPPPVGSDVLASASEPIVEFPLEEFPARFAFQSVNLFISQDSIQAEVELIRDGVETFGSARGENLGAPYLRIVAEATLKAVAEILDDNIRLCLSDVAEVALGGGTAVAVKVNLLRSRDNKGLVGCSLYSGDVNQTAVFATLDAVNRVVGKLDTKSGVEYKIK